MAFAPAAMVLRIVSSFGPVSYTHLDVYKRQLKSTVKLVFQPDEEGFTGAKAMLKAGVLEAPEPQAAMALHVDVYKRQFPA